MSETKKLYNQLKFFVSEYAELCNIEIKSMRKSKKFDGIFVNGYNGEHAFINLIDYLNKDYMVIRNEIHKGFKKPFPKVIKIS